MHIHVYTLRIIAYVAVRQGQEFHKIKKVCNFDDLKVQRSKGKHNTTKTSKQLKNLNKPQIVISEKQLLLNTRYIKTFKKNIF